MGEYQDGASKHLFSYYYMDLIDQMDEQKIIHLRCLLLIGMTNTTYAPSITHIRTNTYACILSDTRFVAEKLFVKKSRKNSI